jgi:hypothetical protein
MEKKYIQLNTIELSLSTDTWKIEIQNYSMCYSHYKYELSDHI